MRQIAQHAGVSPATVTRALRGDAAVTTETRERVHDAATELGYFANETSTLKLVAVLARYPARWYFANMIMEIESALSDAGYTTVFINIGDATSRDRLFTETLRSGELQGIVVVASALSDAEVTALDAVGIASVAVGGGTSSLPRVGIDDVAGGRLAVQHLLGFGHRDIGVIGLDSARQNAHDSGGHRLRGVRAALDEAGITPRPDWFIETESTTKGGAAAAEELLSRPKLPTGLFVMSDEMATGVLWTLRRAGIDVPRRISVIGFDDHDIAECIDLTTVRQSIPTQAKSAAQLLIKRINGTDPSGSDENLPIRLVIRGTTGPLR